MHGVRQAQAQAQTQEQAQVHDTAAAWIWRVAREPFTPTTWRRTAYALLALPLALACIPLALLGAPTARWQRGLVRRFLGTEIPGTARAGGRPTRSSPPRSTSSPRSSRSTGGRSSP